ncbi:MAG TPA: cation-translocating P-type ATPase [Anaerolineaceae bacterium]|nr:cation-translocating P-type ATPase [Anaerolineaceae bacterium]
MKNKYISIELLVTIAAGGALIIGEYWEAAAVTFLFIFGAYLEARTLNQTRKVLQNLIELVPTTVLVNRNGEQIEVNAWEVKKEETVVLKPGSRIAVDGEVVEGYSSVDESAITGESMPVGKEVGSKVFAGTVNLDGLIKVCASQVGPETTLAKIIRRVEEAQDEKAPTQRFIEKFAQWYTPFIIGLSMISYFITYDIELALTLLVIGCPGALVISTPVSIVAGIGRAAKKGILIKGGEYLENAGKISIVAFDKTGTLTEGKPYVSDVIVIGKKFELDEGHSYPKGEEIKDSKWDSSQSRLLHIAAIAEYGSEHPLAKAIVNAAGLITEEKIEKFDTFTGRGVRVLHNGSEIAVGSNHFMRDLGIEISEKVYEMQMILKSEGKTTILVSHKKAIAGIIAVADKPRENVMEALRNIKKIGVKRIVMLTGDDQITANTIGSKVGISEVHSQLLPEQKLEIVRNFQKEGNIVAMVGDGINDAPALAIADLGIAMGVTGTDIAIETADVALMSDDLRKISETLKISKLTLRNIKQNIFIALLTVSVLLAGVILGKVHMSGGMLIHEASVLIVILNGMRLLRI